MCLDSNYFLKRSTITSTGCWEWNLAKDKKGYGVLGSKGNRYFAHRKSYEVHNDMNISEFLVLHQCDNPSCVNPHHLKLGTAQENSTDMINKGRSLKNKRYNTKLTIEDVRYIKDTDHPQKHYVGKFGISQSLVSSIKSGTRRSDC